MRSAPAIDYVYRAELLTVHDGDTYKLRIDQGCGGEQKVWVRLRGVDTPELETPAGPGAREWVIDLLHGHWLVNPGDGTVYPNPNANPARPEIIVQTFRTKKGEEVRSFIRYVADVWVGGHDLAELLIVNGVAARA